MAANPQRKDEKLRKTVIVTGFGPFGSHTTNASWEAVRLLPKLGLTQELGIQLVTEEVPVSYDDVESIIPRLWNDYNPLLVIHVGVSALAKKVTLEQTAKKSGYDRQDIYNLVPSNKECCFGSSSEVHCGMDLKRLCNDINSSSSPIETILSSEAGRYLCEFIYYTSLCMDSSRSLFVHVPPLDQPYSAQQLASGLADIIRHLVIQLCQNNNLGLQQ